MSREQYSLKLATADKSEPSPTSPRLVSSAMLRVTHGQAPIDFKHG